MFEQLPGKLQEALDSAPLPQEKKSAPSQLPVGQSQMPQRAPEISGRSQNVGSSTHRSNNSPKQQASLKRSSMVRDSSPLRDQMASSESFYQRGSQNPYSASNHSPSNSLPSSAAPYAPDLSSMMFPSTDPFAYPNQPMTTLENQRSIKQESSVDPNTFSPPNSSGAPYNNLDYGSLPYMMQSQQLGFMQSMNPSMDIDHTDTTPTTMPTQRSDRGGWAQQQQQQQQQRPGGTPNLDQLFAEDWNGWMNSGYRQYT